MILLIQGLIISLIKNNIVKFKVKHILFRFKKYNIKIYYNTILTIYDLRNESSLNDKGIVVSSFYNNVLKRGILLKIIK